MMDDSLRRQVCRLIAGLVVSDDDLDEHEDAFLSRLLARFDIPSEERDTIFPIVDRSEAAAADGKIAPEERAYLATVAAVVRVDSQALEARLEAAIKRR